MTQPDDDDDVAIPSLLRAARGAYGHSIDHALADADCPRLPRGGVFVLAALANRDLQPDTVIRQVARGERRQQLLDQLADLGVMSRTEHGWMATELGHRAGGAIADGIAAVDAELTRRIGEDGVAALRDGLVALCDIRDGHESAH